MRTEKLTVKRMGGGDWKVIRDDPSAPDPRPGDHVEWKLGTDGPFSVRFQFTDPEFVRNIPSENNSTMTNHWTAALEGNGVLKLALKPQASRSVYYAVFIVPDNEYAIGMNPPPKIDVGPRP